MTEFKLSIVTPVYNNWRFTEQYLKDLIQLSNDHEIILIDNASTDETQNIIKKYQQERAADQPEIICIKNTENLGFAKASNQGYRLSRSNNVLFLNNDIKVKYNFKNWTQILIDNCKDFIVGPTGGILDFDSNFIRETKKRELAALFYISGWCLASSKNNFDKICKNLGHGPFPEYFITYFDDTSMAIEAHKLNIKLKLIENEWPVGHYGKVTSTKVGVSKLYNYAKPLFIERYGKEIKEGKFYGW